MQKTTTLTVALALGALAIAGAAQAGDLDGAKGTPDAAPAAGAAAGKPGDAAPAGALGTLAIKGYTIASSATLTSPPGVQVHGAATCPAGTVPFGGGAVVTSTSTTVNLNSSYPTSGGWSADVNNASAASTPFTVYAICGKQPRRYELVSGAWATVLPNEQSSPTATCPGSRLRPLGGGAYSSSTSLLVNLNSSLPDGQGWRADVNNASAGATTAQTRLVCGKLDNVHVVVSGTIGNAASSQTGATATCDTGLPVGGGVLSDSGSTAVNVNSSFPTVGGWRAYVNNGTAYAQTFTVFAVCAGL